MRIVKIGQCGWMRKGGRGWWMEERGSRWVDEDGPLSGAADCQTIQEPGVETQSGGTSQWVHGLIGVASSYPKRYYWVMQMWA